MRGRGDDAGLTPSSKQRNETWCVVCGSLPAQCLKRDLAGVKHVAVIPTCLWKLSSRRALSSMVALVRKSPARDPGRFSSSAMRWVMRACSLMEKNNVEVGSAFNNSGNDRDDPETYLYSLSCSISTGSRPQGFWMGVMRFCLVW